MDKMTIAEFRKKKYILEDSILNLIIDFEKNVGFNVNNIQLEHIEFINGKKKCASIKIDIHI